MRISAGWARRWGLSRVRSAAWGNRKRRHRYSRRNFGGAAAIRPNPLWPLSSSHHRECGCTVQQMRRADQTGLVSSDSGSAPRAHRAGPPFDDVGGSGGGARARAARHPCRAPAGVGWRYSGACPRWRSRHRVVWPVVRDSSGLGQVQALVDRRGSVVVVGLAAADGGVISG